MPLKHIPAHDVHHADRFEDEATGHGYTVRRYDDAENPMSNYRPREAALWAYREPSLGRSTLGSLDEGNLAVDAFARFYKNADFSDDKALAATRRWLKVFHPEEKISIATATIRGYSQADWLDVVAATSDGFGAPESIINEVRAWAFGDVWSVYPDTKPGIHSIYADSAEEALKYFRENFEDRPIWEVLQERDAAPTTDDDRITELELLVANMADTEDFVDVNPDALFALVKQGYEMGSRHAREINAQETTTAPHCPRHDGPWGDDETCEDCTTEGGDPRSVPASPDEPSLGSQPLDPEEVSDSWGITWEITADNGSRTPVQAAAWAYLRFFDRAHAAADDACVFTVHGENGRSVEIDLSDYGFEVAELMHEDDL